MTLLSLDPADTRTAGLRRWVAFRVAQAVYLSLRPGGRTHPPFLRAKAGGSTAVLLRLVPPWPVKCSGRSRRPGAADRPHPPRDHITDVSPYVRAKKSTRCLSMDLASASIASGLFAAGLAAELDVCPASTAN